MALATTCPVCTRSCMATDVVDFNKTCLEPPGGPFPLSGIPIYYYCCDYCKFCFAPEFYSWTHSDFGSKIYNDEYILVDPDYLRARPTNNAEALESWFGGHKQQIKHIDYGGGGGLTSRLLREYGWNSISYDPFVTEEIDISRLGKFNLITAFEVFEHVSNVNVLMENLSSLLDPEGIILFSTLLSNGHIEPRKRITWWYASPRNGHISLFSKESLFELAGQAGLTFHGFSPGLHAFSKTLPAWTEQLVQQFPPEHIPKPTPEAVVENQHLYSFPPFVELTDSRYGPMLYPPHDQYVGRSFKEYGQFSEGELELFTHFIGSGAIVLDIGANIGAHTVPLARLVGPNGVVVAFEPQPVLHKILCANLVLNSIPNVLTYALALGDCEGECLIPVLDYSKPNNFGGIGMDMVDEGEPVPMGRLDDFQLERVDFIKLDVEGFESKVLEGGTETIARCHPIMYIENDRAEKSAELIQRLFDMGYRLWWHTPPLFSPDNFKGNTKDVFPRIVSVNMLAIHRDMRPVEGFKPILSPEDTWL